MGERLLCKQNVAGSIPVTSTKFKRTEVMINHVKTQALEMANEVFDVAKIVAFLLWMPILVITFLGLFINLSE